MGSPDINKFEQVSSDDHQMSIEGFGPGVPGLLLEGLRGATVTSKALWVIVTFGHRYEQTDRYD